MRRLMRGMLALAAPAAFYLAACSPEADSEPPAAMQDEVTARTMPPTDAGRTFPSGAWEMLSSGEGDGLFFDIAEGDPGRLHLFCPSGGGLLVNASALRPIGSEERMTFGSGAEVVVLVADPAGDELRGGVSAQGPVPGNLAALLTGAEGVGLNYGAQDIGPVPPVPQELAERFVMGCTD